MLDFFTRHAIFSLRTLGISLRKGAFVPSQKTKVVEFLFKKHWDEASGSLTKVMMSLDDVAHAIRQCNIAYKRNLKANNPANFMKDLLRGPNASKNWPKSVAEKEYTAKQRTGEGNCFEFIPYALGQTEPFPDEFPVREEAERYRIQSISIPLVTKSLGRSDESWLIQTVVNLRVVETHFSVAAKFPFFELALLQMGIKLRRTEIDALFLGKAGDEKKPDSVLITCEAKQAKDRLIQSQIINQVQAAFSNEEVDTVVPIGLRAVRNVGVYLIEFEAVRRDAAPDLEELTLASDAIYEFRPPVKGI